MLQNIIRFSLTQRLIIIVLTFILIGAGLKALSVLAIDAYPDVSTTQVKIILKAPGMTPEEVERRIVAPLEQELLGIPNQRILRSISKYALTDITIDFDDSTDIYWARQQVNERLSSVMSSLPAGVSGGLAPITTPLGEMFMFTLDGDASLEQKRLVLDWIIRPQLRTIPGVADVNSLGGTVRSFEIIPQENWLAIRGVSLKDIRDTLANNNRNDGAGRLNNGEESLLVRAEGAITSIDDLKNLVVASRGDYITRLGDVAKIQIGSLSRYGAVTKNGQGETVEGLVLGLRGANASQVVQGVKAKIEEISKSLPSGIKINTFYDRSNLVKRAINAVSKSLAEAIVLVVILLLAFLGNLRSAVVVAIMLPLSAFATFILMKIFGLTANLMSLGGLAIAIGMLVDAAVVIVENIESQLAEAGKNKLHVLPDLHLIYRAVSEVAAPVCSGIIIIIIVFLPLLTLQGLEGKMFVPVALTIVFALSSSLILSLTIVPVLASLVLKRKEHSDTWLVKKSTLIYEKTLSIALAKSNYVLFAAVVFFLISLIIYNFLGKSFIPTMDEGDIIVQLEKIPSISLSASIATDSKVQKEILADIPEVKEIIARVGSDELGLDPMGLNQTDTFLVLHPRSQWRVQNSEWLNDQLRLVMKKFPGLNYSFTFPIGMRVSEMLSGVRGDLAIKIYGPNLQTLNKLAKEVVDIIEKIPGAEDTFTIKNDGVQYLNLKIDRFATGRQGINVEDIESYLKIMIEGEVNGLVQEESIRTPILLRGSNLVRNNINQFNSTNLSLGNGKNIPLASVANITEINGPVKIDRENSERYVVVQSNVRNRDLVGFVNDAKNAVESKIKLDTGYRFSWGGQFENQQRAAARLSIVVPLAILFVFFILFSTFQSLRQAVLVLANIPLAMIGGIIALFISGEYLSVPASIGFIALLGIAVLNGVVMVSYFNQLLAIGMPIAEVVYVGALRRLRPVLMTASISAFGLLPMIFASGPGAEVQKPLAIVVIGGLISSTTLTLLLLPIIFFKFGISKKTKFYQNS